MSDEPRNDTAQHEPGELPDLDPTPGDEMDDELYEAPSRYAESSADLLIAPEQFDELVSELLDELPQEWAPLLDNLAVVVEEEPTEDDLDAADTDDPDTLLGHYRGRGGVPQLVGGGLAGPGVAAPPEIVLFQGPLERAGGDVEAIRGLVRETLVREIGRILGVRGDEDDEYDMDGDEDDDEYDEDGDEEVSEDEE
jgi:predicted Zn-dependent protease with MMP-like domain